MYLNKWITHTMGQFFRSSSIYIWELLLCSLMVAAINSVPLAELQQLSYIGCFKERTNLYNVSLTYLSNTIKNCIDICETSKYNYAALTSDKCLCSYGFLPQDRQEDQLCNYQCKENIQSCGGLHLYSYYATKWIVPHNLTIQNATERSLNITWDYLDPAFNFILHNRSNTNKTSNKIEKHLSVSSLNTSYKIKEYQIEYKIFKTYSTQLLRTEPTIIIDGSERHFDLNNLQPASIYNISMSAICTSNIENNENLDEICGFVNIFGETLVDVPNPKPPRPIIKDIGDTTITISIPSLKNENGPISKIQIIVYYQVDNIISQPFDTELLGSWSEAEESGVPYYITAELFENSIENLQQNKTLDFIIGDGKHYGKYYNKPINNNNGNSDNTHIILGVISTLNGVTRTAYSPVLSQQTHTNYESTKAHSENSSTEFGEAIQITTFLALVVFCCILGFCLLSMCIFYIYLRFRTYQTRSCSRRGGRNGVNSHEMTMQQPIIIDDGDSCFIEQNESPTSLHSFKEQLNTIVNGLQTHYKIPRNRFRMNINHVIANGNYGDVITGKIYVPSITQQRSTSQLSVSDQTSEDYRECQIHVLALDELNRNNQGLLLREISNISKLKPHDHLLEFFGVSASSDWFYVILAHHNMTLKQRLLKSRIQPMQGLSLSSELNDRFTTLSELLILQYIYEIVSAMEYLNKSKILHKKLCSHNIYINEDGKIKVAVFGPIPLIENGTKKFQLRRWLAPEVLRSNHYSLKADVWSFGIVAWECCAIGGTPYSHINRVTNEQLLVILRHGQRPIQPKYMSIDLYQMLLNCWTLEPSDRTNFEELALNVRQLMTSPRHALCFDNKQLMGSEQLMIQTPPYIPSIEIEL